MMRLYSEPFVSSLSTTEFITNDGPEKLYHVPERKKAGLLYWIKWDCTCVSNKPARAPHNVHSLKDNRVVITRTQIGFSYDLKMTGQTATLTALGFRVLETCLSHPPAAPFGKAAPAASDPEHCRLIDCPMITLRGSGVTTACGHSTPSLCLKSSLWSHK